VAPGAPCAVMRHRNSVWVGQWQHWLQRQPYKHSWPPIHIVVQRCAHSLVPFASSWLSCCRCTLVFPSRRRLAKRWAGREASGARQGPAMLGTHGSPTSCCRLPASRTATCATLGGRPANTGAQADG